MHKEYYKSGDNIIVFEDNGKRIEYNQNGFLVEEILRKENYIEYMENIKIGLERELQGRSYPINPKINFILIPIGVIISILFLNSIIITNGYSTMFGLFGTNVALISGLVPIGGFIAYCCYKNDIHYNNKYKGIKNKIKYLNEEIEKEKEEINILNERVSSKTVETTKVDIKTELVKLREELKNVYNISYNEVVEEKGKSLTKTNDNK